MHSQGFTQLKPGALAAIAQEPTLSSALAQLGNYGEQASGPSQSKEQTIFTQPTEKPTAPTTATTPAEPLWTATPQPVAQQNPPVAANSPTKPAIQATNVSPVQETQQANARPSHLDMLSSFAAQTQPKTPSSPLPNTERVAQPTAPVSPAASHTSSQPMAAQGIPLEALLDMDLETTMKRPANTLATDAIAATGNDERQCRRTPSSWKTNTRRFNVQRAIVEGLSVPARWVI